MGHIHAQAEGIAVLGKITSEFAQILTPQALDFVAKLWYVSLKAGVVN